MLSKGESRSILIISSPSGYSFGEGGGANAQYDNCEDIFLRRILTQRFGVLSNDTHVGIIIGKDSDGELLIGHCASGYNTEKTKICKKIVIFVFFMEDKEFVLR